MQKKVLCIGAGYVGGPTMAVMASRCPADQFTVVDIDAKRIESWNSDTLPIFEPGLLEVVRKARGKNLFFKTDVEREIDEAEIIFVSVNTPTKTFGIGKGKAADLQYWEKTARDIARVSDKPKIVVEKSTLPVRTAQAMERILNSNSREIHFEVVSNPEFMAEGTAIRDLQEPDRVLVGHQGTPEGIKAGDEICSLYANWVPKEKIVRTNVWSSELSKLAANAFLAQRVSSINSIAAFCEASHADIEEVSKAIGFDTRIGPKFLKAGVGFGGSCFRKDILNLVYLAKHFGLEEVASFWEHVVKMNEYQQERFVKKMLTEMFNTIAGKKIAIFGAAYKANTSDVRDSPMLYITRRLLEERARLAIFDPEANANAEKALAGSAGEYQFFEDPYKAADEAHAIAVLTDWQEFREIDYARIYASMNKPAFVFDGRNILDQSALHKVGFEVYPVGKVPLIKRNRKTSA